MKLIICGWVKGLKQGFPNWDTHIPRGIQRITKSTMSVICIAGNLYMIQVSRIAGDGPVQLIHYESLGKEAS